MIIAALLVGNGLRFTVPNGNGNALVCFAVHEKIGSSIAFLRFRCGNNVILVDLCAFISPAALYLNCGYTCIHTQFSFLTILA